MASGRSGEVPVSSDEEEELFAGFTVEEIGQIRQDRQRRRDQELLRDNDEEIEAFLDREPQETDNNSDVEVFADSDGDVEDSSESTDEETADEHEEVPPNPIQWSNTAQEITVEECSVPHGLTRDLGNDASAKDFFNLFIGDAYLDEIVRHTITYARTKGDETFFHQSSGNFSISWAEHFDWNS